MKNSERVKEEENKQTNKQKQRQQVKSDQIQDHLRVI